MSEIYDIIWTDIVQKLSNEIMKLDMKLTFVWRFMFFEILSIHNHSDAGIDVLTGWAAKIDILYRFQEMKIRVQSFKIGFGDLLSIQWT